ncbi:MAG: fused response regulator/phosphatase [Candidatus Cloacimonadia bacterium]
MLEKKGKNILIVEDNESFSELLKDFLTDKGYEINSIACGKDGLSYIQNHNPDLLILDMCLPDICGLDVIQRVRQTHKNLPILVVSGISDVAIALEAVKKGAWDYILKPIKNLDVFAHIIDKIWERDDMYREERNYVERLERHSLAAKQMQEKFFPQERVTWNNYTLARKIIPTIDSSGDFIDYFTIDDNHFGFYIADVAGHGVAAAFLTVILKTLITLYQKQYHQLQDDSILHPERMLELLNQEIVVEDYQKHITIFYGIIDTKENVLTFANAGIYPFPILLTENEKSFIKHRGLPLGFIDEAKYHEERLKLPERFSILCFTDGILEIISGEDPELNKQELKSFINDLNSDENDILAKVDDRISSFNSSVIPDDISFLLIKRER